MHLSPRDISALALIVTNPAMPEDLLKRLVKAMESDEARSVAVALTSKQRVRDARVRATAEALRAWADPPRTRPTEVVPAGH